MSDFNISDEDLLDLVFDMSDLGGDNSLAPGRFDHLYVDSIFPDSKDMKRARDMAKLPKGIDAGGPLQNKANPQAKAIQNSIKLIRRSKAVVKIWGTGEHDTIKGLSNPWTPFREKMIREGFTADQIKIVENYK